MMQRRKVGGEFKLKAVKPTPRRDTKSDIYKKMYGALTGLEPVTPALRMRITFDKSPGNRRSDKG